MIWLSNKEYSPVKYGKHYRILVIDIKSLTRVSSNAMFSFSYVHDVLAKLPKEKTVYWGYSGLNKDK